MKESISFSPDDEEKISLNFSELRRKGITYIQEFCGENWTDYNEHDPGVTILDQLCYAITDVAMRTSFDMKDILSINTSTDDKKIDPRKNAFYSPSEIYNSHPVTANDLKKVLLDNFSEIQNVWISYSDNDKTIVDEDLNIQNYYGKPKFHKSWEESDNKPSFKGLEEKLVVIDRIDILTTSLFYSEPVNSKRKNAIKKFINDNRNLGEDVECIQFLEPIYTPLKMEVHLYSERNYENVLADFILSLFEYIYTPVRRYSMQEMLDDGYTKAEVLSGPRLSSGYIKDEDLKDRLKTIDEEEMINHLYLVEGIFKCNIISLETRHVDRDHYFNLFEGSNSTLINQKQLNILLQNFEVKINDEVFRVFEKEKIANIFFKKWMKKYGPRVLQDYLKLDFEKSLIGANHNLEQYYSVQNHFPLIYGIGSQGLPKFTATDRKAKAKQLKGYLLFFEQYLANHLSQLSHVDEFFNINKIDNPTYFTQPFTNSNVPNVEDILFDAEFRHIDEEDTFDRKKRIYDHLLARFGEDLNPLPWSYRFSDKNPESSEVNENNVKLIEQKAEFLKNIVNITADRNKGEIFSNDKNGKRILSGLEKILTVKTGLKIRSLRSLSYNEKESLNNFYIVDHILLREFLKDKNKKYGFRIVDPTYNTICATTREDQFCNSPEERDVRINKLLQLYKTADYFSNDDIEIRLSDNLINNLVTFTYENEESKKTRTREEIKELSYLFNTKRSMNSAYRLIELEKIRAKGIHKVNRGYYGQRRLVLQQKLSNGVIVDEDFFNLSISVVFPSFNQPFDDLQFQSYFKELIIERVPSHIKVNILDIKNKDLMKSFQNVYHNWEILMAKEANGNLNEASFQVYNKIHHLIIENIKNNSRKTNEKLNKYQTEQ